jgi:transcriptional regulator with XRE-family HTH domain
MSNELSRRFGIRLKQLRNKQGWTQVYMAEHAGIDRSYISDMENGKKNVCLPTLQVLARCFGISMSKLLSGL